jgi:hypothetical protein
MRPVILLRIASSLTLLFALAHTAGMPWTPALGKSDIPVVEAMKTHQFEVMGVTRSYFSFYVGFGVNLSVMLLLLAVLIWMCASLVKAGIPGLKPMIAVLAGAFVINAVLTWQYILPIPAIIGIAIATFLVLALMSMQSAQPVQLPPP